MNRPPATWPVCDLFVSIQGEATWSGRPMGFVRFSGCPLACPWCDEPKHRDPKAVTDMTASDILDELERLGPGIPAILLTGGEPLAVAGLETLIQAFKRRGKWLAMESSGVGGPLPPGLDWLTLSPKTPLPEPLLERADEIKYVAGADLSSQQEQEILDRAGRHPNVWLQPRAVGEKIDPAAVRRCLELVRTARGKLRLSLQTHKWIGVP